MRSAVASAFAAGCVALVALVSSATALAQPAPGPSATDPVAPVAAVPPAAPALDNGGVAPPEVAPVDPTGGGYTSPTLLFVPAVAVPTWKVRAILSSEVQGPSDVHAGFRPGIGAELGLPAGITVGAGTNWVGGDVNPTTGNTDFNLGLSPYLQARAHLYGDSSGRGFQLGTAAIYKFVGFEGDPGEIELAISAQYRQAHYELGLQGNLGQDFGDSNNHDGEIHAYALGRPIPQLGLGAAGQVRIAIAPQASDPNAPPSRYDVVGGGLASLTLGQYQLGALAGASSLGLDQGHFGALGQLFGTVRF
jgi:hypothetical protein